MPAIAPSALDHVTIRPTTRAAAPTVSCCQQAVVDALETSGTMGAIATLTILMIGFAMGLTSSWMLFG